MSPGSLSKQRKDFIFVITCSLICFNEYFFVLLTSVFGSFWNGFLLDLIDGLSKIAEGFYVF